MFDDDNNIAYVNVYDVVVVVYASFGDTTHVDVDD